MRSLGPIDKEKVMAAVRIVKTVVEEIDTDGFRRARRATGLSGRALGKKAGVHDQFVSRLERGLIKEVPMDDFNALVDAMVGEGDFEDATRAAVLAVVRGKATLRVVSDDDLVDSPDKGRYLALVGKAA